MTIASYSTYDRNVPTVPTPVTWQMTVNGSVSYVVMLRKRFSIQGSQGIQGFLAQCDGVHCSRQTFLCIQQIHCCLFPYIINSL